MVWGSRVPFSGYETGSGLRCGSNSGLGYEGLRVFRVEGREGLEGLI